MKLETFKEFVEICSTEGWPVVFGLVLIVLPFAVLGIWANQYYATERMRLEHDQKEVQIIDDSSGSVNSRGNGK